MKKIACWWTTIVIALFVAQAIVFTVRAHQKYYTQDVALQQQYAEALDKEAEALTLQVEIDMNQNPDPMTYLREGGVKFINEAEAIIDYYNLRCPSVLDADKNYQKLYAYYTQMARMCQQYGIDPSNSEATTENNNK